MKFKRQKRYEKKTQKIFLWRKLKFSQIQINFLVSSVWKQSILSEKSLGFFRDLSFGFSVFHFEKIFFLKKI